MLARAFNHFTGRQLDYTNQDGDYTYQHSGVSTNKSTATQAEPPSYNNDSLLNIDQNHTSRSEHPIKYNADKHSCLTASFPTIVVLAMVLITVVVGRQYIIDMLIYIESLDWWESMVLFSVMFTVVAFPIMSGYMLLNIACGYTYGFLYGAMMTSGCALYAMICSHFIMRKFCKSYVERTYVVNSQTTALMKVVSGRNGYKIVFLMRFTPIPFGLQNAIFAVSGIKSIPYLMSSALGLLGTQFTYAYMGSKFRSLTQVFSSNNSVTTWVVLSLQLAVTFGLAIFVIILAKRELDRNVPSGGSTGSSMESKGIQTVDSMDNLASQSHSKPTRHSRNQSVNIPPIVASGIHIV